MAAETPLRIGDILYGFCGGYFGKVYWDKRVEAIGNDWVVAREILSGEVCFYEGDPNKLLEYRTDPDEETG